MKDGKASAKKTKPVWRITEKAPTGEWVFPPDAAKPAPKIALPEVTSGGWVISSFDLLHGTDITEGPDTIPGEDFDKLFPPKKGKPEQS